MTRADRILRWAGAAWIYFLLIRLCIRLASGNKP